MLTLPFMLMAMVLVAASFSLPTGRLLSSGRTIGYAILFGFLLFIFGKFVAKLSELNILPILLASLAPPMIAPLAATLRWRPKMANIFSPWPALRFTENSGTFRLGRAFIWLKYRWVRAFHPILKRTGLPWSRQHCAAKLDSLTTKDVDGIIRQPLYTDAIHKTSDASAGLPGLAPFTAVPMQYRTSICRGMLRSVSWSAEELRQRAYSGRPGRRCCALA